MRLNTGVYGHHKRVYTASWLWKKNPLPNHGIKPALAVCWSYALPTEMHPSPTPPQEHTHTHTHACMHTLTLPTDTFTCTYARYGTGNSIHVQIRKLNGRDGSRQSEWCVSERTFTENFLAFLQNFEQSFC